MNQESLIEAIGAHLDSIRGILNVILAIALLTYWSGLSRTSELEVFGLKIQRKNATLVVGTGFLLANIGVLLLFVRLSAILAAVDKTHFGIAVSKLTTHNWLLNPFAFFGDSVVQQASAIWGYGGLITVWWFCNTALYLIADLDYKQFSFRRVQHLFVSGLFLFCGLGSMAAIQLVYFQVRDRGKVELPGDMYLAMRMTEGWRSIATFAGIGVGGATFFGSQIARAVLARRANAVQQVSLED